MKLCSALAFLVVVCAAMATPHRRPAHNEGDRIMGGTTALIKDYPYQAVLQNSDEIFVAGGSIIGKNVILTAAHCALAAIGGYVKTGADWRYGGSLHKIIDVKIHPNYIHKPRAAPHDIAILRIAPEIVFDDIRQPIKLYDQRSGDSQFLADGVMLTVTGYGVIYPNGPNSKDLMVVNVPVTNKEKCNKALQNAYVLGVDESRFCAGYASGGMDSCQGDSGGPIVRDGYQVGIVSYGVLCGYPKYPGVYTNVSYYFDWIKENSRFKNSVDLM